MEMIVRLWLLLPIYKHRTQLSTTSRGAGIMNRCLIHSKQGKGAILQRIFFALLFLAALSSGRAAEREWPKLVNGKKSGECRTALSLARAAFRSNDFLPWMPDPMPSDLGSKLVSGNNDAVPGMLADPAVFTRSPLPEMEDKGLYWQMRAQQGQRFVIEEVWSAMHDTYRLLAIDAAIDKAAYLALRDQASYAAASTLFYTEISVPLVFQKDGSTELWAIDQGSNADFLPAWKVYTETGRHYQPVCEIRFRPAGSHAPHLLPPAVQRLAVLLSRSVGSVPQGREGTFHYVFISTIGQTWANAAMRPWAGPPSLYGSRPHVDMHLKKWSRGGPDTRKTYLAIQAQLPLAECALSEHYKVKFNMRASEAAAASRTWIDRAYRAYYLFPD